MINELDEYGFGSELSNNSMRSLNPTELQSEAHHSKGVSEVKTTPKSPDEEADNLQYRLLAKALEIGLKNRFEKTQQKLVEQTFDATPSFILSQQIKVFVMHLIWGIFGPFGVPLMLCIGSLNLVKNMGFVPVKDKRLIFFIA